MHTQIIFVEVHKPTNKFLTLHEQPSSNLQDLLVHFFVKYIVALILYTLELFVFIHRNKLQWITIIRNSSEELSGLTV